MQTINQIAQQDLGHLVSSQPPRAYGTATELKPTHLRSVLDKLRYVPLNQRAAQRQRLLRLARLEAYAQAVREDYYKTVTSETPYIKFKSLKEYADYIKAKIVATQPNYDFSQTRTLLINLCKYFYGDTSGQYDTRKALMLMGKPGCGKSFLMRKIFGQNPTRSLDVIDAVKISLEYQEHGQKVIDTYTKLRQNAHANEFGSKVRFLCFDDIGVETTQKHYGNELNVMQVIMEQLYAQNIPFFGTTNLNMAAIAQAYGGRIDSRFNQMFNLVDMFYLPDYRKILNTQKP